MHMALTAAVYGQHLVQGTIYWRYCIIKWSKGWGVGWAGRAGWVGSRGWGWMGGKTRYVGGGKGRSAGWAEGVRAPMWRLQYIIIKWSKG